MRVKWVLGNLTGIVLSSCLRLLPSHSAANREQKFVFAMPFLGATSSAIVYSKGDTPLLGQYYPILSTSMDTRQFAWEASPMTILQ